MEESARHHFYKCLDDNNYDGGWAHYRLSKLYDDFDPLVADIIELRFHLKWKRPLDAVPVLERIVKSQPPDSSWEVIHELFLEAAERDNCDERSLFAALPSDVFESVISGLTKRYDAEDVLKTKMFVFALQAFDDAKLVKLLNRAVTFLTERASNDKENLIDGIGRYHVYVAMVAVPALLKLNFTSITSSRALNVLSILLHVVIAWPNQEDHWTNLSKVLKNLSVPGIHHFCRIDFALAAVLLDKCIELYDLGMPVNFNASTSCNSLIGCVDKAVNLKSEARKVAFSFLIWYAYCTWRRYTAIDLSMLNAAERGETLGWLPEDNWVMDVDKLLSDKSDGPSQNKKPRLKEKREQIAASQAEHLMSTRRELCEAYELCCATLDAFSESAPLSSVFDHLHYTPFFPDVQRFIGESLLFKFRLSDAITLMNEKLKDDGWDIISREKLNFQLACANCLEKNWPAACESIAAVFSSASDDVRQLSEKEDTWAMEPDDSELRPMFKLLKRDELWHANYDLAYHILFRVYTSTAVDHDNDQLLGALLVFTQVDWAGKGYKCFNRIMRHIEAKGSLKSAGLIKHITNIAIVEELYRIHVHCAEYVSIQVAPPQVQRRIGQATRHSIMGTKDGQKQALEEQIRCCSENPYITVSSFFRENKDSIMKMLGAK